jgi:hypothetical protein
MSTSSPEGAAMVVVRLSSVPRDLRVEVAEKLIEKNGLPFSEAILLKMAALNPKQDPEIVVTPEKAERVLAGRQPVGPGEWQW